ncbi:MAG: hypothetical protein JG770_707 [Mahella sp.]|nr:hypothetical protein [Mahella sp.]
MLYEIANNFPHAILKAKEPPFISIYEPTVRYRPENKQNLIRYKNLIKNIEDSLKEKYPKNEIDSIMKPLYALADDEMFWVNMYDGLAVLAAGGQCVVYKLQRPVKELAVAADSFHIKPLIRIFQTADRYHVLGLNRKQFMLYEGNMYGFEEVQLDPDTPRTIEDALGIDEEEVLIAPRPRTSTGGSTIFYGYDDKNELIKEDTEKFFRFIDKLVYERYSRQAQLPLLVVALPEYYSLFKEISRNPFLIEQAVKVDYTALTKEDLKKKIWEAIEPLYREKTKKLVERFGDAKSKGLGSDDIAKVAMAAFQFNIDTILIEEDRIVPGKVDPLSGEIKEGNSAGSLVDDVLDDLGEMVFRNKGNIVVLPKEQMPTGTGVAAIFKYKM